MLFTPKTPKTPKAYSSPPMHIPKTKTVISEVGLYPVLKIDELLLADPKRCYFLNKIHKYTGLETPLYQALYETAITQFVELVQLVPYQEAGKAGSLMDYSLERAVVALQYYHQHTVTENAEFSPLWAYALFTAGLFQDVGKLIGCHAIDISDEQGGFVAEWLPLEGSLSAANGSYYKFRTKGDQWIALGQSVTPLLARQYMPAPGFEWIASDSRIFLMWMDVLLGAREKEGDLLYWLRLSYQFMQTLALKDRLQEIDRKPLRPAETAIGEDFLAWLSQELREGRIRVNEADSHVHVVGDDELLLEAGIFRQFCKIYGHSINWVVVCKQFNRLGAPKLSGHDYEFEKFFSKTPEAIAAENIARNPRPGAFFSLGATGIGASPTTREGLVINRLNLLYLNKAIPAPANLLPVNPVVPKADLSLVQQKVEALATSYPIAKPFLAKR